MPELMLEPGEDNTSPFVAPSSPSRPPPSPSGRLRPLPPYRRGACRCCRQPSRWRHPWARCHGREAVPPSRPWLLHRRTSEDAVKLQGEEVYGNSRVFSNPFGLDSDEDLPPTKEGAGPSSIGHRCRRQHNPWARRRSWPRPRRGLPLSQYCRGVWPSHRLGPRPALQRLRRCCRCRPRRCRRRWRVATTVLPDDPRRACSVAVLGSIDSAISRGRDDFDSPKGGRRA